MSHYILIISQRTTATSACLYDKNHYLFASAKQEFTLAIPQIGRVELDPENIWRSTLAACRQVLAKANVSAHQVVALGIANHRETVVAWHKQTGEAVYPAITWQDRRTYEDCQRLKAEGLEPWIQHKTGLVLDAYFSMSKMRWILQRLPRAKALAQQGLLAFGTIESFLVWRLTGGQRHLTDVTNASRTMLMNLHTLAWDEDLLQCFGIPRHTLPEIVANTGDFGLTQADLLGHAIPITALAGYQQAAMIGQACIRAQQFKAWVGTGAFLLLNTGANIQPSSKRLISTVAYRVKHQVSYALEGSVLNTGMAVKWLRDQLGVIQSVEETESLARSLRSNDGVYLIPAFTGLGAPYWQPNIQALCWGMSQHTTRAHLARAALEAVAYQLLDIKIALEQDSGYRIDRMAMDGALSHNAWLVQFLADMLDLPILMTPQLEASGEGVFLLTAIGCGWYEDLTAATQRWRVTEKIQPKMAQTTRHANHQGWLKALRQLIQYGQTR